MTYDVLLDRAYEAYKRDWCRQRGVVPEDVDEEVGIYGGQCFVCRDEFEDAEFRDREYMAYLLSNEEFLAYQQVVTQDLDSVILEADNIGKQQMAGKDMISAREEKSRD